MSNHTPVNHLVDEHKKESQQMSSSISKEGEPIKIKIESKSEKPLQKVEQEPQAEEQDVEKYIKPAEEKFSLDPELKKAGLQVIDASDLDPRHHMKFPISDAEILEGLDKPVNSSWRWLSELAQFLLRQSHISIKKIHGHVVRVFKK